MRMFGNTRPPSSLTGPLAIVSGDQTIPQMNFPMPVPQQVTAKPSWLEGGKFTWKDGLGLALGAVGDALSGQPIAATRINNAFQHQRDLREAERQRTTELSDWLWKQQWQRDHPAPVNNDTVADYNFISSQLGPDAGKQYLQNKANPPVWRQGPDGQFYRIDTPQGAAGVPSPTSTMPPETLPSGFDFGEGGSAGNGTGGFR